MGSGRVVRVAAVEMPVRFGDPRGSLARLGAILSSPGMEGVDVALLPEAALTGYVSPEGDFDLAPFAEPLDGPTAAGLAALARRHGLALAGPLIERDGDARFNALLLFDAGGERIGHWRKRHPWSPERWATPGDLGTPVVSVRGIKVTAGICYDVHFLSHDAAGALDEADVLLFPSAWVDEDEDDRADILPALARRHDVWVVNANWGRSRPRIRGQGGSRILDRAGRVIECAGDGLGPRIVRADVPAPDSRH
jgi:5-aminopentanamidase